MGTSSIRSRKGAGRSTPRFGAGLPRFGAGLPTPPKAPTAGLPVSASGTSSRRLRRPSVARRARSGDLRPTTEDLRPTSVYVFPTELGWIAIGWTGDKLHGFTMGHPSASAAQSALDAGGEPTSEPPAFVRSLAERIASHVAGSPENFRDVPLDLSHLTDFQRKVVEECRKIRPGQMLTYGELAAKAGYPGAARAVGSTMARNRFPIVVPCHRVVGAGGSLGGFSAPSGISLKKRLLEVESKRSPSRPARPR